MGDYLVVLLLIQQKLVLFYKITQGQCPEYLTDLMPPLVSESINYNLWSSQHIPHLYHVLLFT